LEICDVKVSCRDYVCHEKSGDKVLNSKCKRFQKNKAENLNKHDWLENLQEN